MSDQVTTSELCAPCQALIKEIIQEGKRGRLCGRCEAMIGAERAAKDAGQHPRAEHPSVKDRCTCVLRDHIPDDKLPPICRAFVGHDGDFGWVCASCGHEEVCHPAWQKAPR